ncbi:MAG: hypothetical protein NZ870_01510 [bacterium]|nr:hypothetical protein [bacterium]
MKVGISYYGNRYLKHFEEDINELEGMDFIVHAVSEEDFFFHKKALEKIIYLTKKNKLEAWIDLWGFGGVFGGECFSGFLQKNYNLCQIASTGELLPAVCMRKNKFIDFIYTAIDFFSTIGADCIFIDEPHLYFKLHMFEEKVFSCSCGDCMAEFKKIYGYEMPERINEDVYDFMIYTIKNFVRNICIFSKKKKLKSACTIYAFSAVKKYEKFWNEIATIPELDIFGTDPYWRSKMNILNRKVEKYVSYWTNKTVKTAKQNNKSSLIWLQAFRIPSSKVVEIEIAYNEIEKYKPDYIAIWSYDAGEILDNTLSDNPEAIKLTIKKLIS